MSGAENAGERVAGAAFRIVDREEIYSGWASLSLAKVERRGRDGGTRLIDRLIEDHGTAAGVLPYDPARRQAILVRQFRAPVAATAASGVVLEAIAGLVDAGETPRDAARREAYEEAGLALDDLVEVGAFRSMPGVSSEEIALFLAEADLGQARVAKGGGAEGETEDVEVVMMALADLARLADERALVDMKTFLLVQTLRLRRPELFAR